MKYVSTVLLILLLTVSVAYAGNPGKSDFDQSWEITVTDCKGISTIYKDCLLTYDGLFSIAFMPNQGRIPTGNGPVIKVYRSQCTEVTMIAK